MQNYYIAWGLSIILTYCMEVKFIFNIFKDLADRGYKFNIDKMSNISNKISSFNGNNYNQVLDRLFPFIPVINILYMFKLAMDYSNNRELLIEQFGALGVLEIMDDLEQEEYEKKPTGLNAVMASKKVERRLEAALRIKIETEGEEGEIFYELEDGEIKILKTTGKARKFSQKEQEYLVYQTLELIYYNGIKKYGDSDSFMKAMDDGDELSFDKNDSLDDYDVTFDLETEKEELEMLKEELLGNFEEEKGKSYTKKRFDK